MNSAENLSILSGLGINILSDFIAGILLILLSAFLGWLFVIYKRRKLHRFWGIRHDKPFLIYLSSLPIKNGSVFNRNGIPTKFQGLTIPDVEYQAIQSITTLLNADPFSFLPGFLVQSIELLVPVKKPSLKFLASPLQEGDIEFADMLTIGSGFLNAVTDFYSNVVDKQPEITLHLDPDKDVWEIKYTVSNRLLFKTVSRNDSRPLEELAHNEVENTWYVGIITRHRDALNNTTVFTAAGSGVYGTRASVEFLVKHWSKLNDYFKDEDFSIILKCKKSITDPQSFKNPKVIWPEKFAMKFF